VKEVDGNLWEIEADWRVITTNGFVKKDGRAVMGRGVARQALQRYLTKRQPDPISAER